MSPSAGGSVYTEALDTNTLCKLSPDRDLLTPGAQNDRSGRELRYARHHGAFAHAETDRLSARTVVIDAEDTAPVPP